MALPTNIPEEKRILLEEMNNALSAVAHVKAVVLGGSYAGGTFHSASDLDIGVYYLEAEPFSIEEIKQITQKFARKGTSPTVSGFYEWGAWVNGGAWIETNHSKVDFLYRNLDQVQRTIQEALEGKTQHDYDQQPTNGFYSVGYLAETSICLPLYDPEGRIAELKKSVANYPPKLKQAIINNSLWGAEFSLSQARGFAEKADIYNTTGCLARIAANLTQALFALNERYFLSDKKVMEKIEAFSLRPADYVERLQLILAFPGSTAEELCQSILQIEDLWREIKVLAGETYQPKY
jgi:predicted nucleotidyltransferase